MKLTELTTRYIDFKRATGMRFGSEAWVRRAFGRAMGDIDLNVVRPDAVLASIAGDGPVTAFCHRSWLHANVATADDHTPVPAASPSCYVNLQEKKKTLPVSGTSHRFLHFPLCTFRCVLPRHADAFATIASLSAERPVIRGRGRSHASRCLFVRDQETFCASHFRPCWQ